MSRRLPEAQYTVAEVAEAWRCSKNHIYDLISSGQLRSIDIARSRAKTRIPESALADFLQRKTRPTKERAA